MASFKYFRCIRETVTGFLLICVLLWQFMQSSSVEFIPETPGTLESISSYALQQLGLTAAMKDNNDYVPPPCETNPFLPALEPLSNITRKMDEWFLRLDELGTKSLERNLNLHDHQRYFPITELTPCKNKTCVGGKCSDDTSKIICGLNELNKHRSPGEPPCIIYSIGGNNQWEFELSMLEHTTCDIHTFDCTGPIERFQVPANETGRLHFHHVCISDYPQKPRILQNERMENEFYRAWYERMIGHSWTLLEMQQKLEHKRIDLLKVDAEGFEFPLLSSWPELMYKKASENILLPMQIILEIHYRTQYSVLHPDRGDFKTATDLLDFQAHLMRMGYVVTVRDDNPLCRHCIEVTLIRARCPNTGVYAASSA